jgi:putative DNA methylase
MNQGSQKKKLIEVALPLEAINAASAREKSIRHGHPSTLHLWWARRPLATCRAVLFASLVDDPSSHPDKFPTEADQERERKRLFRILEDLVKWENSTNEEVLQKARAEILASTDGNPPPVLDPFCGGGSIPLEAQRLGLEAHASDLNPVAVLITKALIEIPPKFAGKPPVHPDQDRELTKRRWKRAEGLAEDVRYYGEWMRAEAEKRIGHLYPKVRDTPEMAEEREDLKRYVGKDLTVIAWLWARTVTCPNPACGAEMPLVRSFWLSKKKGKQAWVEPIVERESKRVAFEIRTGEGEPQDGTVNRRGARCVVCGQPVRFDHVRSEGRAGRMGSRLMAIVVEGDRGRLYFPPSLDHIRVALSEEPPWRPNAALPRNPRNFNTSNYGMRTFADLFTDRQLVALTTFSDLVGEARERVLKDALAAGRADDGIPLSDGGTGTQAYADAVATYLGFVVDRCADYYSSICTWHVPGQKMGHTLARQAIPMTWDFAEANPFSNSSGNVRGAIEWVAKVIDRVPAVCTGTADQRNAMSGDHELVPHVVCTDPPYYDNIGYADLSDFFYVWLRRSLGGVYADLFETLLTPKAEELVATPYRFEGGKNEARAYFESGMRSAFEALCGTQVDDIPLTLFYAFKQTESNGGEGTASTGWETMLSALLNSGLTIRGTWPIRSEMSSRSIAMGTNALASSIVLVCRPRTTTSQRTTRSGFLHALKDEMPTAIRTLQRESIAPVDLAQAAIGPGMAVFSRFREVLEADGSPMSVRTALALINQVLDEILAEQEGDYDPATRWALAWFSQVGFKEESYGRAETLATAKNTSIQGLADAGILKSGAGKVRLLSVAELPVDWDPATDPRFTVWEITHHLVRVLNAEGEAAASELVRVVGPRADAARDLAYRLYQICERKGWAQEALGYNTLAVAWPEIQRRAAQPVEAKQEQQSLELE